MLHSLEKNFFDCELCIVGEKPLQDEESMSLKASERPRKWTLFYCGEGYDFKTVDGLKKFSPIYTATQAEVDNPKPIYVVEKDGQFMTTQGYPVIYIGRTLDKYGFKDAERHFKGLFNDNDKVYSVFFDKILVPSLGSGIPASEMKNSQRAFSASQSPKKIKKQEDRQL